MRETARSQILNLRFISKVTITDHVSDSANVK